MWSSIRSLTKTKIYYKIILSIMLSCIFLILFLKFPNDSQGINLVEMEKERLQCFEPKTVTPNLIWMLSVDEWFYPEMSRLDLSTLYLDLTGKKSEDVLEEQEIHENSCIKWTISPLTLSYTVNGYGFTRIHQFWPVDFRLSTFKFVGEEEGGLEGIAYTTLTDHKTFTFSTICLTHLNEMSWGVASIYKTLPKETLQLIHEHASSLGFNPKYFTRQSYENCSFSPKEEEKISGIEF